jgi:hypothetical protein
MKNKFCLQLVLVFGLAAVPVIAHADLRHDAVSCFQDAINDTGTEDMQDHLIGECMDNFISVISPDECFNYAKQASDPKAAELRGRCADYTMSRRDLSPDACFSVAINDTVDNDAQLKLVNQCMDRFIGVMDHDQCFAEAKAGSIDPTSEDVLAQRCMNHFLGHVDDKVAAAQQRQAVEAQDRRLAYDNKVPWVAPQQGDVIVVPASSANANQ